MRDSGLGGKRHALGSVGPSILDLVRGDGHFLVGPSTRDDGIFGDGDFTSLIPAAEGVDALNVAVCILDFNRAGIGVGIVNGVGGVMRDSGLGGKRHALGSVGPFILDRVLLQCHFTGGDGEVDDNIFADRQSCFAVEGIIAIVLSGNFFDGFILRINHDRVSLGISVVSGIAGCFRSTGEAIGLREIPFGFSTKISRSYTSR